MVRQQDTPGRPAPEARPDGRPRLVFALADGLPAAEAAERLVAAWRPRWEGRPATLVRVPARRQSALVEHLRPRLQRLPAAPGPFPGFRERIRTGLDDGGTLIAGGRTLADGAAEPTLFLNLDPAARMLQDPAPSGPLLAVLLEEDGPSPVTGPAAELLRLEPDPQD